MDGFFKHLAEQEEARVSEIYSRYENGMDYDDLLSDPYEAADMGLISYENVDAMEDV